MFAVYIERPDREKNEGIIGTLLSSINQKTIGFLIRDYFKKVPFILGSVYGWVLPFFDSADKYLFGNTLQKSLSDYINFLSNYKNNSPNFALTHPFIFISILIISYIAINSTIHLYYAKKERNFFDSMLKELGVSAVWKYLNDDIRAQDWKHCVDTNLKSREELRILGATGFETFISKNGTEAPLNSIVFNGLGNVRIMLINPLSVTLIQERIKNINSELSPEFHETRDSYVDQIKRTVEKLATKYKEGVTNIELRFYSNMAPTWKLIFGSKYIWIQSYISSNHIDKSSIYVIEKPEVDTDTSAILYNTFDGLFERIWKLCKSETVLLDNWEACKEKYFP